MPHVEKIKHFDLVRIEKCGHSPQLEKPEEFNRAVVDFLKRGADGAGSVGLTQHAGFKLM